jgi:plastocyanin domain-containing protein
VTAIPQFTAADGVVEVRLAIENTRFVPAIITLPADTPVRLIVERREANPCSDQLAVPQIGVRADLAPDAVTVVDLPAAAAGTYTLTCGMGMMSGQLRIGAGAAGLPVPPADGAAVTPGSGSGTACACCAPVGTAETVEEQAVIEDGVQRITVSVENGYKPNVVQLAAGVPAEITFGRGSGCMAQVMSEDLGFYEDLTAGPRTVRLEALTVGTYEFSCGMRMVFGTIVVQ